MEVQGILFTTVLYMVATWYYMNLGEQEVAWDSACEITYMGLFLLQKSW